MRNVGIVAEYNPFHNGHEYQIKYAKNTLQADTVIVVMSGNFIQRGGPAVCDKTTRAKAAINAGADIVVELPLQIATSEIMGFAQGAICLLNNFGCNSLLFGSECGNITLLSKISDVFLLDDYSKHYNFLISSGIKKSEARLKSINLALNNCTDYSFVNHPNNLLGICYICAIKRGLFPIEPFTHKRKGQNYFDNSLPTENRFASATAIRDALFNDNINKITQYVPKYMFESLKKDYKANNLLFPDDFYLNIKEKFSIMGKQKQECFFNEFNYQFIADTFISSNSYHDAMTILQKKYPKVKIERCLFRFLLDCPEQSAEEIFRSKKFPINVLATKANNSNIPDNIVVNNQTNISDMLYYNIQNEK